MSTLLLKRPDFQLSSHCGAGGARKFQFTITRECGTYCELDMIDLFALKNAIEDLIKQDIENAKKQRRS